MITLDAQGIKLISMFESVTHTRVKDCIQLEDRVIFIVEENQIGIAIGKKGKNVADLKRRLKKNVQLVEYSSDPVKFLKNIFRQYNPQNVYLEEKDGKTYGRVEVPNKEKGRAIGAKASNLEIAKMIIKRHFDIENILITSGPLKS